MPLTLLQMDFCPEGVVIKCVQTIIFLEANIPGEPEGTCI